MILRHTRLAGYGFVLPALVLMFVILLVPVLVAAVLSFTDYSLGNSTADWLGWKNYEKIFTRSSYQKMLWASALYVLIVVPVSIALGLAAALAIHSLRFGGNLYKTIYFLPVWPHCWRWLLSGKLLCILPSES